MWGSHSQKKIAFIDAQKTFLDANKIANNGKYLDAVSLLHQVNKNDSLYLDAMTNKSYYLLQIRKFNEVIKTVDSVISIENRDPRTATLYINKMAALISIKKSEEALKLADKALELFPVNHLLNYNKALAYEKLGKPKKAIEFYQKTISYKPLYANPHLRMGNLCYQQGLFAQALMCFNTYLLLNPDGSSSKAILKSLNNNVTTKYPNKKNPDLNFSVDDSNFESIDLILNSHLALNESYQTNNPINISLTKQTHALLTQLKDFEATEDFWGKRYIPLYQWIFNNNHFNNFIYTITYSSENSDHKKIISKNLKEIKSFLGVFRQKWIELLSPNKVELNGENKIHFFSYNNYSLASNGGLKDGKEFGLRTFYHSKGNIQATGFYNENNKKDGDWKWYYENGKLKETGTFKDGLLQGKNILYHNNGRLYIDAIAKDSKLEGEYKYYLPSGALAQKKYFKEGKLNGSYTSYFSVGEKIPEFKSTYSNDSIVNSLDEHYAHGEIYQKSFYKNGQLSKSKRYYVNGNLWEDLNYKEGKLNGPYTLYFNNKKIAQSGQIENGDNTGPWKTYFRNGILESEFNYQNGKIHGIYKHYSPDGKPYYEMQYRKGEIISYKFFDKKGNIIKEARKKAGEFLYEGYNPNGSLLAKGIYDVKGGKSGEWKFYSNYGVLSEKGNYKDDKPIGKHFSYFSNGNVKIEQEFKEGLRDGYYVEFHPNGNIKKQGWNKDDKQHGEWRDYFIDGSLKKKLFFHKGEFHGEVLLYDVNNKLVTKLIYEYGNLLKEFSYNENHNISYKFDFNNPEKEEVLVENFSNGKIKAKIQFLNKVKHGPSIFYAPNGKIIYQGNYSNGNAQGKHVTNYNNGKLKYEYNYLNNNLHGKQIDYYENGKIDGYEFYEYGEINGKSISYYKNGNVSHIRNYVGGVLHGKYKFFAENGKLQLIRIYNHGELIGYSYHDKNGKEIEMIPLTHGSGKIVSYYDNGKTSKEMEFYNGEFVNSYKEYYYSGEIKEEMIFLIDDYHGKKIEYFKNGKIKAERNYIHGIIDGKTKIYHENGKLKLEENYKNGDRSGISKEYSKRGKLIKEYLYFNDDLISIKTN